MRLGDLEIRPLQAGDERSFLEALEEAETEVPPWVFAFGYTKGMRFSDYVHMMEEWAQGRALPEGYVPAEFHVGVLDGVIVGRVSMRFSLNAYVAEVGGHIGYGVRAAYRRRGYASVLLRHALRQCAAHGMDRALVTCNDDNAGSIVVLERNGGVFERMARQPAGSVPKRHYWISTAQRQPGT